VVTDFMLETVAAMIAQYQVEDLLAGPQPSGCSVQHRSVILAAASIRAHRLGEPKSKCGGFQWEKAALTAISD
jgi:hypothetical protein